MVLELCITKIYNIIVMEDAMEKERKKPGPKPSDGPLRTKVVTLRMYPADYEKLAMYAESHNMTVTQTLYKGLDTLYKEKP